MSAALLFPAGLVALLALALPLIIHLARRSEVRPTDFAALRWLSERPRPRHRLRLDEIALLLIRLLLLALLAIWLARPVLFGSEQETAWVAVIPGVDVAQSGAADGVERHWLAPGFPTLDMPPPVASASFPSLLRELDAALPRGSKLTVVVPETLQGADAERPRLSRAVEWRIVPGAMPLSKPPQAEPLRLIVCYAPGHQGDLRYLRAAAAALRLSAEFAPTTVPVPTAAKQIIWLGADPLPDAVREWVERGGTVLLASDAEVPKSGEATTYWRDNEGASIVEGKARGRGRVLRFTRPLVPAKLPQLLDSDFPQRLSALFARPTIEPSRVFAKDYRPTTGAPAPATPSRNLQPWLALLIAAVVLSERWLATRSARAAAP